MLKRLVWILVLMLFFSLLWGCSSRTMLSITTNNNTPKEVVKLRFWGGVPEEAGPKKVVEVWNKDHPDIQVEYVRFVNDEDGNRRLDTALMTGQGVDLFVNYVVPKLQQRVHAGLVTDLREFSEYDIEVKMGPDVKEWKMKETYYALPTKRNIFMIWLNKDALDEANLPIPTEWTWDELRMYAQKLTTTNRWGLLQEDFVIPYPMDGSLINTGYVKRDGTSNLDHAYVRKALEINYQLMHEDFSTPPLGEQLSKKMPIDTMFLSGEAAMLHSGEWLFRSSNNLEDYPRRFKIAFAPIPRLMEEQKDFKTMGGLGDAISIYSKSNHKKEAWEFLKWYADEGVIHMARGGRLPASKDADIDQAMQYLLENVEDTYDIPSLKDVLFGEYPTFQVNLDQQVIDIRREEYENYFLQKATLEETISTMVNRHNQYLKTQ